jgi:hypothetical protein
MLDAWMHSKVLLAYVWTGTAMLFAQSTPVDPALPGWISGVTQITGWGVLGWLVYHTHSRTLPKQTADFMVVMREERTAQSAERALDRKEAAEMLALLVNSHTASWEGVRDRIHFVGEHMQVLSAKVQLINERAKQTE